MVSFSKTVLPRQLASHLCSLMEHSRSDTSLSMPHDGHSSGSRGAPEARAPPAPKLSIHFALFGTILYKIRRKSFPFQVGPPNRLGPPLTKSWIRYWVIWAESFLLNRAKSSKHRTELLHTEHIDSVTLLQTVKQLGTCQKSNI